MQQLNSTTYVLGRKGTQFPTFSESSQFNSFFHAYFLDFTMKSEVYRKIMISVIKLSLLFQCFLDFLQFGAVVIRWSSH